MEKFYTLIFLTKDNGANQKILLGLKKARFGEGKWNGFGGKLEKNETKEMAAIRELKEESGLNVLKNDLKYLGYVVFENENCVQSKRIVYIFHANKFYGNLVETEEMRPKWFDVENLPYDKMWPDSIRWVPFVLEQKYLVANFIYEEQSEKLLKSIIYVKNSAIDYQQNCFKF